MGMYDRSTFEAPRASATADRPGGRPVYSVSLDPGTLKRHDAGTGPDGERRVRYSLELVGPVDDRWRRSLRAVQLDDTGFFRFRLEMGSRTVAFTSSEQQAQAELAKSLKQLDTLVTMVNRTASLAD